MSGAIAEGVLEFVAHLAGCVVRQPLQTDGGPRDVTTQMLGVDASQALTSASTPRSNDSTGFIQNERLTRNSLANSFTSIICSWIYSNYRTT
jgi:hypothetical protein